jgi:glycosyltransferase involved in cell wall biosynthesis
MISVVIPAFNAGRFIRRTIDSVLAQNYAADEIIVVDDGSTDNTAEIVKSYGQKVRYIYQKNAGDGPARNTGIKAAGSDWIAFLDHDDQWLPQRLSLQKQLLERNPHLKWCGGNFFKQSQNHRIVAGDEQKTASLMGGREYFDDFFVALGKHNLQVITSTMLISKECFEKAGVFESCYLRQADLDMWWRIAYQFPLFGYIPKPLAILHIEVQDIVSTRLRWDNKKGHDVKLLMSRHIPLSKEYGRFDAFALYGKKVALNGLISTIFHGFKNEARDCAKISKDILPWYWYAAAYILTVFPKLTSFFAKKLAYLLHLFGFEKDISRRWVNMEMAKQKEQQ